MTCWCLPASNHWRAVVSIARSSFYYAGQGENPLNLRLMRLIDEQFLETPFYGSRQMTRWLRRQGDTVSRKRVRRLMRLLGVHALFQRPRTSQPHPAHRIYPYLLRDLRITRPNHVWCTDVTYIPLQWGFLYCQIRRSGGGLDQGDDQDCGEHRRDSIPSCRRPGRTGRVRAARRLRFRLSGLCPAGVNEATPRTGQRRRRSLAARSFSYSPATRGLDISGGPPET